MSKAKQAKETPPEKDAVVTPEETEFQIPGELPLLPVRDIVIFPLMVLPLFVGREFSVKAVDEALGGNRIIFLATQKKADLDQPTPEEIHAVGTVAMIMRMLKLPDGRVKILVQGLKRGRISSFTQTEGFYKVALETLEETTPEGRAVESEALIRTVREQLTKVVSLGRAISPDIMVVLENLDDPGRFADLVTANLGIKAEEAQEILELLDPVARLKKVYDALNREVELLEIQRQIQSKAKGEIDRSQREYFLREQLKAIQDELGDADDRAEEITAYREKIEAAQMPEKALEEADRQLRRLEKMHPDSAESAIIRTYLDWMVELAWNVRTRDRLDIPRAKVILDEDHYDLEKVKERILEYLGVRKLKKKMRGPILCFVGPPGVGKTSLGRSIARALGRKFVRISLGGIRDEAEIRGHRRTYVGALPGRIIQGLRQAGTRNPVFMLDEIDKVGADFRGDPSAALLEVLDPEQNNAFSDNYLQVPFDLSEVMFITTANLIDPIPPALQDRMEVIDLPGYTDEEKLHIARRYLVPRQTTENGLSEKYLSVSDSAILKIIRSYTREAGLRNLERELASVCRKVARAVSEGNKKLHKVTGGNVQKYLGVQRYLSDTEHRKDLVGVATGLAWTQFGGEILHVEATLMPGKGGLTLTGHLGEVMKESAMAALSYTRAKAATWGIVGEDFSSRDIHIHVPAGAIPKDGPSAGITMVTALLSALTDTAVRRDVAMTGEITLRGEVLPIGGVKEKVLAARRVGIRTIILPIGNKKDLSEIPPKIRNGMTFHFAETIEQAVSLALVAKIPAAGKKKGPAAKAKAPAKGKAKPGGKPAGKRAKG
jgi:ATP-dependent Lon protease